MPDPLHLKRHTVSFGHAFRGLLYTVKTQPNLRIHLTVALVVILAGWYVQLTRFEWLVLLFTIAWVITAEMLNTAIESMVNLITQEYHTYAKHAKDVSAAMVLIAAIMAVVVGLFIFIPYLLPR